MSNILEIAGLVVVLIAAGLLLGLTFIRRKSLPVFRNRHRCRGRHPSARFFGTWRAANSARRTCPGWSGHAASSGRADFGQR